VDCRVRPLQESDLSRAEEIIKISFSKQLGYPDPALFGNGAVWTTRFRTDPDGVFGAEIDGELVGVIFAIAWGSFGFFGPLCVLPDYWGQGVAQKLLKPIMDYFKTRKVTHSGLFTFSNSPKHICLYQKFGFEPRFLTATLIKKVPAEKSNREWLAYCSLPPEQKAPWLDSARALTGFIYKGLDVEREIQTVEHFDIGETVFVRSGSDVSGIAVCHTGAGSEAEQGGVYIKFAAAKDEESFSRLIESCESMAQEKNAQIIVTGVNTARVEAYKDLLSRDYAIRTLGVAMEQHGSTGFNCAGVYVLDDWR